MRKINLHAATVVLALLHGVAFVRADEDPYLQAHPPAGIQPVRPDGYVPYNYPYTPEDLLRMDGKKIAQLGQRAWADLEKVNAAGPFKNTFESLSRHQCPEWFKDAKVGMFIDWGPWSVAGYASPSIKTPNHATYPDWYEWWMYNKERDYHEKVWGKDITDADLINLLSDRRFNPADFAILAKECGFRYVVPFLKHHGGFCLWDNSFTRRDSMDWAFHRDFAAELAKACKKQGLKFGVYTSIGEWGYPEILPDGKIGLFGFSKVDNDPARIAFIFGKVPVKDYVHDYFIPSLKELIDRTQPDLIWYDGWWEMDSDFWHTRDFDSYYYNSAQRRHQEVCVNDRWGQEIWTKSRPGLKVDFATTEYGRGTPTQCDAWEECRSFSKNYGYNWTEESDPNAVMDDKACIGLLADIVGRGGNLLLIVSPTGSGEIPPRQLHALRNLGSWLQRYGRAIYATRAYGLASQPKWGRITHSKDGSTVYLLITDWPADGRIEVPALPIHHIAAVEMMGGPGAPGFTQPDKSGAFMVDMTSCRPGDPRASVVQVDVR